MFNVSAASLPALAPEIALAVGAMLVLLLDVATPRDQRQSLVLFSLASLAISAYYASFLWGKSGFYFSDGIVVDSFRISIDYILLLGAGLTLLMSGPYLEREGIDFGEYYTLVLFATLGMMILVAAADLTTLFVGLETMSISVYILAAFNRKREESNEAGLKYLLTGSFATAFLLYGMALIYGATGETRLNGIGAFLVQNHGAGSMMMNAGVALLLVGIGFKIAMVPFHMWAPDVYEGAPTTITAFMSAGVKVAAFAAMTRVFTIALAPMHSLWGPVLGWIAILTMTLGNLVAVTQSSLKRMLAYSSIAQAGYLLIGIAAGTTEATSAMVYYLTIYTVVTMGSFAALVYLGKRGEENLTLYDLAGVGYRYPALGAALAVLMMSLSGLPPTAGFMAKFILFRSVVQAGLTPLVIVAVLNSVVSVYYYMGVVVRMFMTPAEKELKPLPLLPTVAVVLGGSALATLLLGIFPGWWLENATRSVMVALGR